MKLLVLLSLVAALPARAADPAPVHPPAPFAVVFIDARTETALGPFPYDRAKYAQALDKLAAAQARGVILKFFIDAPKTADGDAALVAAMAKVKVVVQARLDDEEKHPNALPARFVLNNVVVPPGPPAAPLAARSGWLPIPAVAAAAHDLAFLDSAESLDRVPMAVQYQGQYVKSLYTAAAELAADKPAKVTAGRSVTIGPRAIPTDNRCMATITLPQADGLVAFSFIDLINDKVAADALKDKVVILGYDGAKMPTNQTPAGPIKGHRLFCYQLFSLWADAAKAP